MLRYFLLILALSCLPVQLNALTLDFSGDDAPPPSCYVGEMGGARPQSESGFHYSGNEYSTFLPYLEISDDGGSDFTVLVHETCAAFSVLSMNVRYYDLFPDPLNSGLFGIYGFLSGNLVASLEVAIPRGSETLLDFGSFFSGIDLLRMVLLTSRYDGDDYNGLVISDMRVLAPVPVPSSLPALAMALIGLGAVSLRLNRGGGLLKSS